MKVVIFCLVQVLQGTDAMEKKVSEQYFQVSEESYLLSFL